MQNGSEPTSCCECCAGCSIAFPALACLLIVQSISHRRSTSLGVTVGASLCETASRPLILEHYVCV